MSEYITFATYGFDFGNEEAFNLAVEYLNFRYAPFYDDNKELLKAVSGGIENEGWANDFGNFFAPTELTVKIGGEYWESDNDYYEMYLAKSIIGFLIANGQHDFNFYVFVDFHGEYNDFTSGKIYKVKNDVIISCSIDPANFIRNLESIDPEKYKEKFQELGICKINPKTNERTYNDELCLKMAFVEILHGEKNDIENFQEYVRLSDDESHKERWNAYEMKLNEFKSAFETGKIPELKKYVAGTKTLDIEKGEWILNPHEITFGFDPENEEALNLSAEYLNFRFAPFYRKNNGILKTICKDVENESSCFDEVDFFVPEGMTLKFKRNFICEKYTSIGNEIYYENLAEDLIRFLIANGQHDFNFYVQVKMSGSWKTIENYYRVENDEVISGSLENHGFIKEMKNEDEEKSEKIRKSYLEKLNDLKSAYEAGKISELRKYNEGKESLNIEKGLWSSEGYVLDLKDKIKDQTEIVIPGHVYDIYGIQSPDDLKNVKLIKVYRKAQKVMEKLYSSFKEFERRKYDYGRYSSWNETKVMLINEDDSLYEINSEEDFSLSSLKTKILGVKIPFASKITIPESITEIDAEFFSNSKVALSSLESLEIPETVFFVPVEGLKDLNSLKSIRLHENALIKKTDGSTVPFTKENAGLSDSVQLDVVPLSEEEKEILEKKMQDVFEMKNSGDEIILVVNRNKNMTKLELPENITRIASSAFNGNRELVSVTIPPHVKVIESQAFQFCSKLEKVDFPKGIESIEKWAFYMCKSLKKVSVPEKCVIHAEAFPQDCKIIRMK